MLSYQTILSRLGPPFGGCINVDKSHADLNVFEEMYPVNYSSNVSSVAMTRTVVHLHVSGQPQLSTACLRQITIKVGFLQTFPKTCSLPRFGHILSGMLQDLLPTTRDRAMWLRRRLLPDEWSGVGKLSHRRLSRCEHYPG